MKNKDSIIIGLLLGMLAPTIGIYIFYLANYAKYSIEVFIDFSIKEKLLSPLLSLCCVINLGIFYLFIHFDKFYSARGVILGTFIYGFFIVMLKFFM